MRKADVFLYDKRVGVLLELELKKKYQFSYNENYFGEAISLRLPTEKRVFDFEGFPPFFEGLLPEGIQLDSLIRKMKIDRDDLFLQLITVGSDLVGAVTVKSFKGK